MKKKIIGIGSILVIAASIGVVLANNKAKIDKAANPVKTISVVPVKVNEVKEDSFNTAFSINGTTTPEKEVSIASEVQGKLVGLYVKSGDQVKAGQVIASLDAGVYRVQLASTDASIAKAQLDLKRYTKLVEMGGATPMQIETVQLNIKSYEAQKREILEQISHMQIRAPFTGKIENVKVELGSFVSYGTVIGQLIDNSSLKIKVYLSEKEAFKVKEGQEVAINSVLLTTPKKGRISTISDKADASGKFEAEVNINNTGTEKLKAGVIADVSFTIDAIEPGLAIPISALVGSAQDAKVFVVNGNKVEQKTIKTGIVTTTNVQVLQGLQAGDQVVVSGQVNLENGTPITINK